MFGFLHDRLGDGPDIHLLSFGCSVGDEVFSLRRYFPAATITGIDISAGNIRSCRRRTRREGDNRMRFYRSGSASREVSGSYDAVLCMAVLRHGDLGIQRPSCCAPRLTFAAFERTVADLARFVKAGGYLTIEHSNFRFCDTASIAAFEPAMRRVRTAQDEERTPQYGRDNLRLDGDELQDVIFRKL